MRGSRIYVNKKEESRSVTCSLFGGGCGIRTHVGASPNGFQDSCPSPNIVEMCALHSKSSFLLIGVTRSPRRHTVSSRLRSPVMTASITLRIYFTHYKKKTTRLGGLWRRQRDSNPRGREPKRFSRPPRYDRFDMPPYSVVLGMTASITLRTTALYHNRGDLSRLYYKKGGIP